MANINKQIEKIRSSIYGKDVRESIASTLESMNSQCEQTESFSNDKVEEMNHLKQTLEEAEQTRIMNESERSIHENERISEEAERNLRFQALDRETQFQHNQIISQQAFLENAIAEWNDQKDRGEFHGSFWLYGNGVPNDDIGKMNDWYIDRSSKYWCIYHRDHSGWTDTGRNLIGNDGSMGGDTVPIGAILPCTTNSVPDGWLLCDGSSIMRRDYPELFDVIGESYGAGDGVTTFALPNILNPLAYTKSTDAIQFIESNPELSMIIKAKQAIPLVGSVQNDLTSNSEKDAPSIKAVNQAINKVAAGVPEILMNTTKMEKSQTYTLNKSIDQFRYLLIIYSALPSLSCMNTMLVPVGLISKGTSASNQFNLHCRITETSYSYSQVGFLNSTTLRAQTADGNGNYPDMYVKICGIR